MILTAKKRNGHFSLLPQDNIKFNKWLATIPDGSEFVIIAEKGKKARSIQQSKYYWSVLLPMAQFYIDDLSHVASPQDRENAHYQLKLNYCSLVRPDLIEVKKIRIKGEVIERALPFSWRLSEMPSDEAQKYIDWVISIIESSSKLGIDLAILDFKSQTK